MLSVVVIGLNEEARLRESLSSIIENRPKNYDMEVFYVDSGSADRSVEIASAIPGVQVLHLPGPNRSAARARNLGLRRASGRFVQLVDGDSVIQSGWIKSALDMLDSTPDVACVFGQCVEMFPEQSIYMKVCGLDWHIPAGDYRLCGGNAMWRMSAISENGFFDEALQFGEEPDLCYRVRQRGSRIVCIERPMVTHDLGMLRFGQYWKRAENTGKGYARVASRYWRHAEKLWLRELIVNFTEPLVWVTVLSLGFLFSGWMAALGLFVCWLCVRTTRIAYSVRKRGLSIFSAMLYGVHCQFYRLPMAIGQAKVLFRW